MPSDEEALLIAFTEIDNSKLSYGGETKQTENISYITDAENKPVQINVTYHPKVDGLPVYGIFRTTVEVGADGKIVYFSKQSFKLEKADTVKLKSLDEF